MFNRHNLPKSLINEVAGILNDTHTDYELPPELQAIVSEAAKDYIMCTTQEDRKSIVEWHIDQVIDINELDQQMIVNFERAVEYAAVNEKFDTGKILDKALHRGYGAVEDLVKKVGAKITGKDKPTHDEPGVVLGPDKSKAVRRLGRVTGMGNPPAEHEQPETPKDVPPVVKGKLGESLNEMAPLVAGAIRLAPVIARTAGAVTAAVGAAKDLKKKIKGDESTQTEQYQELIEVLSTLNESEFEAYLDLLDESQLEAFNQMIFEMAKDSLKKAGIIKE